MTIERIETIRTATLVAIYNEFADKPVKKFKDRATAEKRTLALLEESGMVMTVTGEDDYTINPAVAEKAPKPRTEYNGDAEIDVNVGQNPKRKGSAAHARFELYKKHNTVDKYLDACVKLDGEKAKPRHRYLRDLRWDEQHQFITVWTDSLKAGMGEA